MIKNRHYSVDKLRRSFSDEANEKELAKGARISVNRSSRKTRDRTSVGENSKTSGKNMLFCAILDSHLYSQNVSYVYVLFINGWVIPWEEGPKFTNTELSLSRKKLS